MAAWKPIGAAILTVLAQAAQSQMPSPGTTVLGPRGEVLQAGAATVRGAPQPDAIDAARNAASRSDNARIERYSQDSDGFLRAMGITVHGEGVATPEEINEGGRVTLFDQGPPSGGAGAASAGPGTGPGGAENAARMLHGRVPGGAGTAEGTSPNGGSDPGTAAQDRVRAASPPGCVGVGREGDPCSQEPRASDPVAARMVRGLERDPGVAPPPDIRVHDRGLSTPACMENSLEGVDC